MNPFEHTKSIAFELSNYCNMAHLHTRCPLSVGGQIETLPAPIVGKCLAELRDNKWTGIIVFNQYNEPMLDPRLFMFIYWVWMCTPKSIIQIETNGINLTKQMARDLAEMGRVELYVTLYGTDEEKQAMADWLTRDISPILPVSIGRHLLDNRMDIYDNPESGCNLPCCEPLGFVTVTCAGKVGLCCYDWKRTVTFGDLREKSLAEILTSPEVVNTFEQLQAGNRQHDVCKRCERARC